MKRHIRQKIEEARSAIPQRRAVHEVYSARGYHNRKIKPEPPPKVLEEADLLALDRVLDMCDQRNDGTVSTRIARMLIHTIRHLRRGGVDPATAPASEPQTPAEAKTSGGNAARERE